jgi:hypothetical protein
MTRQQEVQILLDKISQYIINDSAVLKCDKVKKAEAFISMSEVCKNLNNDKCEDAVKQILMEEIPWIVDVHVYKNNR